MPNLFDLTYAEYALRLVVAVLLGGLVGYEREVNSSFAGFRTHILVCTASALIMVTSENLFYRYFQDVNIDPMRMGAQVISGIGFLGAGTIIRDGFSVRGLTTAACLWAVACIGLAVGAGFYFGAVFSTIIVFVVLHSMRRIESFWNEEMLQIFYLEADTRPETFINIENVLDLYHVKVKKLRKAYVGETLYIKYNVMLSRAIPKSAMLISLKKTDGVISVYETIDNSILEK